MKASEVKKGMIATTPNGEMTFNVVKVENITNPKGIEITVERNKFDITQWFKSDAQVFDGWIIE